jgi:amidase
MPVVTTEPAIRRAVERVTRALADLGHDVDGCAAFEGTIDEFLPMFQFLAANAPVPFERALQGTTRWLREAGRTVTHAHASAVRDTFATRMNLWFGDADVCVTPTVAVSAPAVFAWAGMSPKEQFFQAAPLGAFTAVFNASGHPAITVPVRLEDHPLPIGVQLIARHGDDARLLALARSVMEALGTPVAPVARWPSSPS